MIPVILASIVNDEIVLFDINGQLLQEDTKMFPEYQSKPVLVTPNRENKIVFEHCCDVMSRKEKSNKSRMNHNKWKSNKRKQK